MSITTVIFQTEDLQDVPSKVPCRNPAPSRGIRKPAFQREHLIRPSSAKLLGYLSSFMVASFMAGCGPKDYKLTRMEDALELDQVKTQASFQATVLEVETSGSPDASSPTNGPVVSNLYVIRLKDASGKKRTIAGWNASDGEIDSIKHLVVSNAYTFPDVIFAKAH